ncbi:MAG: hypothetical protein FWF87_08185 [Synergistaceae bacterium]|nr:hypothetical protein [Synergistaceae bacterium]
MLHGAKLREACDSESKDIVVKSTDESRPFSVEQISEDSIDLRLSNYGYIINDKYEYINTILKNEYIDIKYIHSFCDHACRECPEDKTSLWVTAEGKIRTCCYGNMVGKERNITDWSRQNINNQIMKYI